MRSFTTLFTLLLIAACATEEEKKPYSLPDNYQILISENSAKTWKLARRYNNDTRMNMAGCFLSYKQTFKSDGEVFDNLSEHRDCGESLRGKWKVVKDQKGHYYVKIMSSQLPELMNIEEDFKLFKVLHLSADEMIFQFRHKQFSNKASTITDILVPENASVDGRDFHW